MLANFKRFLSINRWIFLFFIFSVVFVKMYPTFDIYVSNLFFNNNKEFVLLKISPDNEIYKPAYNQIKQNYFDTTGSQPPPNSKLERAFLYGNFESYNFYLSKNPLLMAVFYGVNYVTPILISVLVIMLLVSIIFNKTILSLTRKKIIFLMLALALAPGIVVNLVLKEGIGRPRPDAIVEFGGTNIFTPALQYTNQCTNNCSFVSGHSSFGFYLMSFGLVAVGVWRKGLITFGFLAGASIGAVRVIQGRHFFTDVLFSFFVVWLTMSLLYELFFRDEEQSS